MTCALRTRRPLAVIRSFLHGCRIKAGEYDPRGCRASIIVRAIDSHSPEQKFWPLATARELAELDPSLSWLPGWKPRERIAAITV